MSHQPSAVPRVRRIRRHPERAVPEQAPEILAAGLVAHVGIVLDGRPSVIPMLYAYDPAQPDRVYLHGLPSNETLRHVAAGEPVCLAVTLGDGLVYSKDAKYHSANYRSVVAYGAGREITDLDEKWRIFQRQLKDYFPAHELGRDYAPPSREELLGTIVVEVRIEEWAAKARTGGPMGPRDDDPDAPGTRGVLDWPQERG